jgi:hypothetical protein
MVVVNRRPGAAQATARPSAATKLVRPRPPPRPRSRIPCGGRRRGRGTRTRRNHRGSTRNQPLVLQGRHHTVPRVVRKQASPLAGRHWEQSSIRLGSRRKAQPIAQFTADALRLAKCRLHTARRGSDARITKCHGVARQGSKASPRQVGRLVAPLGLWVDFSKSLLEHQTTSRKVVLQLGSRVVPREIAGADHSIGCPASAPPTERSAPLWR